MHEGHAISKPAGRVNLLRAALARVSGIFGERTRLACCRGRLAIGFVPTILFALLIATTVSAETTNSPAPTLTLPPLPEAGPSIIRVIGALALVLGIFFGGAWLFRNWQRLTIQRGRAPRLNVIETRPLGGKHALYVIGYDQERFLLASSPTGVNLLTHLPAAAETDGPTATTTAAPPSFAQAFAKVLKGK